MRIVKEAFLRCGNQDEIATYIAEQFEKEFKVDDGDDKDDEDSEEIFAYTCTVGTSYGEAIRFNKFCLELKLGKYKVRICD